MVTETDIEQNADQPEAQRLLDKTIGNLRRVWKDLTGAARVKLTGVVRPELPEEDCKRLMREIDECLEGKGGEVSGRAMAANLGRTYLELNAELSREWPVINVSKDPLPDASEWDGVEDKLKYLER